METYFNPVIVLNSYNWLETCREMMAKLGIVKPIVITSKGTLLRLVLESVFPNEIIFSDVTPNPTIIGAQLAINYFRELNCDGVIAIGGGSVLDTAKVIMASKGTGSYNVKQILEMQANYSHHIKSIFIPTTHGSGSEVTMWATIWDTANKKKCSISHTMLYPDVAILDGSLTLSLPLETSIISVLDALSHSFEAIWNKNRNPLSTEYAIAAICSILRNVGKLKGGLDDLRNRQQLLRAANTAGLAFSNTKTAAAHSIGYPLTSYFGVPHGLASFMALIPLLKINSAQIVKELDVILTRLKLRNISELEEDIRNITDSILRVKLSEWGVSYEDLKWLTPLCFQSDRIRNNIVVLSESDVRSILEEIF